jgi:DNA-binding beta-propeller fold protein YncE
MCATTALPDASGADAGQGFSIAGFAYDDADGTWWAVNGGLNYDGSPADRQQSLVHLSADFSTNLGEIDLDAVLPDLDTNDESPQAVAVDNANGYLWVASPTARVIHCFDKGTGTRVPANDITRGYDIGSLALPRTARTSGSCPAPWGMPRSRRSAPMATPLSAWISRSIWTIARIT